MTVGPLGESRTLMLVKAAGSEPTAYTFPPRADSGSALAKLSYGRGMTPPPAGFEPASSPSCRTWDSNPEPPGSKPVASTDWASPACTLRGVGALSRLVLKPVVAPEGARPDPAESDDSQGSCWT